MVREVNVEILCRLHKESLGFLLKNSQTGNALYMGEVLAHYHYMKSMRQQTRRGFV
jgi:hypothetical protein